MQKDQSYKWPRLHVEEDLKDGQDILLDSGKAHYLKSVMRRQDGDPVRLFNGRDGEWQAQIRVEGKKTVFASPQRLLKEQPDAANPVTMIFAPIKSSRMDWMIEKAVELGVTNFVPVLTQNTEVRKINPERISKQILEAAEQCERLDVPSLSSLSALSDVLQNWPDKAQPLYACLERMDAAPIQERLKKAEIKQDISFLIGPVGGFTDEEKDKICAYDFVQAVTLGETVLRCETAAMYFLSAIKLRG